MTHNYDIIIFGGGVAGLFVANRLQRAGYNLILIEKDKLGGVQTLASQGMIHGGQKYAVQGTADEQAHSLATLPSRWDACFEGWGDIDLSSTKFLSKTQLMFPAASSFLSRVMVFLASKAVRGHTQKLQHEWVPPVLKGRWKFPGAVYEMQEKVLDVKSLVVALAAALKGRLLKGEVQELLPDGQVAVSGVALQAQVIIFTAGIGNETAFQLLRIKEQHAQRRPLRQIMVKPLPEALYGHGIVGKSKPRVTVTSHPLDDGQYVWYLGGSVAEEGAKMSETEALRFAKKELQEVFPAIDWDQKEWAAWYGERAEAYDPAGQLPAGPCIQQRGKVLAAWPTKLTFAPVLADRIFDWLKEKEIMPSAVTSPPPLPEAEVGFYPWEEAAWQRL